MSGKKLREVKKDLDQLKEYSLVEAVALLKKVSFTNFDSTVEVVMKLNVDPRHSNQMVRGVVAMPSGTGKKVRVAVICKDDKVAVAKDAGADIVGSEDIIEQVQSGQINFDVCIATPDMMGLVGRVARVLGPKGLMPNPKLGTVTMNIKEAVEKVKSGQVEYRVEKAGIIHAGIGKVSFEVEGLVKNAEALIDAVIKARPVGIKGSYLKGIYLSSTMGPSCKVQFDAVR